MAVDNAVKRHSALHFARFGVPLSDGAVAAGDRQTLLGAYVTSFLAFIQQRGTITGANLLDLDVQYRTEHVKWEILNANHEVLFEIHPIGDLAPRIELNINATIKRVVTGFRLATDEAVLVNTITHRVRPTWVLDDTGDEYPLGVFLFAPAVRPRYSWGDEMDATLYDLGFALDQARRSSYSVSAGALVTDALEELAVETGVPNVNIEASTATVPSAIGWPIGTSRRLMMAELCALTAYYSPYFDNDGVLRCRSIPSIEGAPDHTYPLDSTSRVFPGTVEESDDLWEAANVYIARSTSFGSVEIAGVYEIPASAPHSVANRGFEVAKVLDDPGLETSAQAEERARAAAAQDSSTYRWVDFDATPDPRHDTFDLVEFDGVNYREQGWTLECRPGGPHHHRLRRNYLES